jgi:hypothetical protein
MSTVAQAAVMNNDHQVWVDQVSGEDLHLQDIHKAAILHITTKDIQLLALAAQVATLAAIEGLMAVRA